MITKSGRLTAIIGITLLVLGSASVASAQIFDRGDRDDGRSGLTFGFGADVGHLQLAVGACPGDACEGMTRAVGLNANVGLMLTSNLGIVGEVWGMAHRGDNFMVTQGIATVGPKLWLGNRFWVKGGVGAARAGFRYDAALVQFQNTTDFTLAAAAATGFELISRDSFALDLQLRGGSSFFGTAETRVRNLGVGLGLSWY